MGEEKNVEQITKNELTISKAKAAEEMGLIMPKNIADQVINTMTNYTNSGLKLAPDYNVQNAIMSSYLIIQQDIKLKNCTKISVARALIDMATMSLNANKKQCYFVPYKNEKGELECQCQPSYFGKIMAIKRITGVVDVVTDVIYKGTDYELSVDEYGNDDIKINKPCSLEERNFDNLVGAWAKIILDEKIWGRKTHTCIMTMDQIRKAWNQGAMKGQSPAHKNFTDEMAKKTVINRCCKNFVNSARDNDILIDTLNRVTESEYETTNYNQGVVIEATTVDI